MKLSFVIPVYNAQAYIGRCLDSLLDQDIDDYEIICINDGSKDDSLQILNDYSKKHPNRFNIISQENQGIGPARNNAFKAVKGEYTWFIDNDDCIQPNCLKNLFEIIDQFEADITNISDIRGFFAENPFEKSLTKPLASERITQDFAMYFYWDAPWSKIYRTAFLRENNLSFSNIFGEDTAVTFDLYSKAKTIIKIKEPLYAWFERNESFSHAVFTKKHFETFPVLLETLKRQSMACPSNLKIFYEKLIINKADVYLNHFKDAPLTDELAALRDECIEKSEEILRTIPKNIFIEIDEKNQIELKNKLNKVKSYYENSTSWKITKPLRKLMQFFRKIKLRSM